MWKNKNLHKIIMKKKTGMVYKKNRMIVEESTKHKNNWRQNIFFNTIYNTIIKLSLGLSNNIYYTHMKAKINKHKKTII